jgi:hypothetical protein
MKPQLDNSVSVSGDAKNSNIQAGSYNKINNSDDKKWIWIIGIIVILSILGLTRIYLPSVYKDVAETVSKIF